MTSILILQFPLTENSTPLPPIEINPSHFQSSKSKIVDGLPESYANVKAISDIPVVPFKNVFFLSDYTVNIPTPRKNVPDNVMLEAWDEKIEWIEVVDEAFKFDSVCKSWTRHHSEMNRCESSPVGINTILPLITNEVCTIETQYHCMTIIKNTFNNLIGVCD